MLMSITLVNGRVVPVVQKFVSFFCMHSAIGACTVGLLVLVLADEVLDCTITIHV